MVLIARYVQYMCQYFILCCNQNVPPCPRCGTTKHSSTTKSLRTPVSRWCQVETPLIGIRSNSPASGHRGAQPLVASSSASNSNGSAILQFSTPPIAEQQSDDKDGFEDNVPLVDIGLTTPMFGQDQHQRRARALTTPQPLPERVPGISEAAYALQIKYLLKDLEIHAKSSGELGDVARNELYLMKWFSENGTSRDQGQKLLDWLKSVISGV